MKRTMYLLLALALLFGLPKTTSATRNALEYLSPRDNAQFVSAGTTIALRFGPQIEATEAQSFVFDVVGSLSGELEGTIILAEDQKTVIFRPDAAFTPGEQVTVLIDAGQKFGKVESKFSVSEKMSEPMSGDIATDMQIAYGLPDQTSSSQAPQRLSSSNYLTLPADVPVPTVDVPANGTEDGFIFTAPFGPNKYYLLILDNNGEPVYYKKVSPDAAGFDFKKQPNGLLTYFNNTNKTYYVLNANYKVVDAYQAGNGYNADMHEFQMLPNGNVLLMIYDQQTTNMSVILPGGRKDATVTGLIIQEIDPSKNVIWEWRSWDWIPIWDSSIPMVYPVIDYVHGNSIEVDTDNHLILSARHLNEIFKIHRVTGEILWRLGGKQNQFEITNDIAFGYQHDARRLANGNLSFFDNQEFWGPSRALEYQIDVDSKKVTKVWEFKHDPPVFARAMGNAQRLQNENTLINWGMPVTSAEDHPEYVFRSVTEAKLDGTTAFEFSFPRMWNYRAFRFEWQGYPTTHPDLASKVEGNTVTLGYSWNGATEVASYKVYGGSDPENLTLLEQKDKTGFETQSTFYSLASDQCYFKVVPVDKTGTEMTSSDLVSSNEAVCLIWRTYYLPVLQQAN